MLTDRPLRRSAVRTGFVCGLLWAACAAAQPSGAPPASPALPPSAASPPAAPSLEQRVTELTREVDELKQLVRTLQQQLSKVAPGAAAPAVPAAPGAPGAPAVPAASAAAAPAPATASGPPAVAAASAGSAGSTGSTLVLLPAGVTVGALLDGYYEYNFNSPVGQVNSLRAYDVSANSFSLSQADLLVESAPDLPAGKRWGLRLDYEYGQATSTTQGNPANEPYPDVYRNVFQAYGTYVFDVAQGLTVDFGKWSSALGIEGNYSKDQLNYSRSFWFDYLPFYHMGFRANLKLNDQWALNLWLVNGANQTQDFNGDKDALVGFVLTPVPTVSWTVNLYGGQEHQDVLYLQSPPPGSPSLPSQQGTYLVPIVNAPNGRIRIADSYVTWQATPALQFAAEADYVQEQLYTYSPWEHVTGGALYMGYQISPKFAAAVRAEYLADVGGLYSGITQYLKEGTLTLDYRPANGFLVRGEYRRDQSNQLYFWGPHLNLLESSQPTLGVGLVWWFGGRQGAW